MARKSEEYLFDLIKSLTRGEKRTFRQLANYSSAVEKIYFKLFDIMDSQKQYDETVLLEKFKKEKIKTPLPRIKNYLHELILKSLRFHYSGRDVERKLQDYISIMDIYHAKGLTKLRDKTLEKAKQLAINHEQYEIALLLLNKKWHHNINKPRKDILTEQKPIIEKIITIEKYKQLHQLVGILLKRGLNVRDEKTRKEWDEIIQDPLMDKSINPSCFEAYYYYHHIYAMYYDSISPSDIKNSLYHRELLLQKIESCPDLFPGIYPRYMALLINIMVLHVNNKDIEKLKKVIKKLFSLQDERLEVPVQNLLEIEITIAYSLLIHGYILTINFDDAEQIVPDIIKYLENKKIESFYRSNLILSLLTLYMHTGDYHKALIWNNALLNELTKDYRENIDAFARLFNLIIHYELGNDDLLPYIIRSTYRVLYKRERLFKTEDAILAFMRNKLPKSNSRKDVLELFKELKTELVEIAKDPYEANAHEDFNYISWLESKSQNKTMVEILKGKSNK